MDTTDEATAGGERTPPLRPRPLLHYKEISLGVQNRKIRLTSVHASDNFLACGASNGNVFLYVTSVSRAEAADAKLGFPAKYHLVKTISPPSHNDRAGVSCLSICPSQKRLVVGTMGGVVYGIQLTDYNKIGEKVEFTHDFHKGFPVTCFVWDRMGTKLYSACNGGMVAQTTLRAGMSAFFGKTDTELLLKEDTGIVQLDVSKYGRADILMVSSQIRVLLLNLSSMDGSAVQIGTKPRQGNFGACFFVSSADDEEASKKTNVKVFSARPGRRVWVADPQTGAVSATLKFPISKNPSLFRQSTGCNTDEAIQSRDLTISKLALYQFIQDPYAAEDSSERSLLISWNTGSSVIFFLDPIAVEIVEWHLDLGIIHDLKVMSDSILVALHGEPPRVSIIQSCSPQQFLDIYAGSDVRRAVEMAVEYQINDAAVLNVLNGDWEKINHANEADCKLIASFNSLLEAARDLDERHRASDFTESLTNDSTPLQVIFKQRPQQSQTNSNPSDLFASGETNQKTLDSKKAGAKTTDYLDVRATPLSYRRNIYAPDGTTLEARMTDIKELNDPIVQDDYRDVWMEDILDEVRRFEAAKAESEGAMNLLPSIRGTLNNTGAAAKAIATYIPGANMVTSLMDTAASVDYSSAMNIFGDLPDVDSSFVLDPVECHPKLNIDNDAHECAVLRIAMSSSRDIDSNTDTEVLLEAISMDIWDSKLKYISNLPLDKQISLPDTEVEEEQVLRTGTQTYNSKAQEQSTRNERRSPFRKSKSAQDLQAEVPAIKLTIRTNDDNAPSQARTLRLLNRRNSLSPDAGRSAQRALQRFIGGGPTCDFQRKCIVSGQLASTPELEMVLKREVADLISELNTAAATAEKTARITKRLWPAAGITRVCACLTNMFLLEGDMEQAQKFIRAWLTCFDPTAKPEEQIRSPTAKKQKELSANKNESKQPGFARGEALIDGDGLPLTRSDWTLVRVMVSIYFAISTAGSSLIIRPVASDDFDKDSAARPYAYEMGVIVEVGLRDPDEKSASKSIQWSSVDAEDFVKKYGIYLNTELAAEICNQQQMGGALNAVLDQVVSSSNMSSTCDDVVNWIVEKQVDRALDCLKETNSICLMLHVLDLLLKKSPHEAVDLCVSNYPSLSLWNIERCLFGAHSKSLISLDELLKPENIPQTATYFRYLIHLLESHPVPLGHEEGFVDLCIQLCFAGPQIVGETFKSDKLGYLDQISWLCQILRAPKVYTYTFDIARKICVEKAINPGILELAYELLAHTSTYPNSSDLDELIYVLVHSRDLAILDQLLSRASTLPEEVSLKLVNKILHDIEATAEKGNDEVITTVVHALLNSVGASRGMAILSRFPLLFAASPLAMYRTVVEAHLLDQRLQNEMNQMLETVDTHSWAAYKEVSKRDDVSLPPQIKAVFDLERRVLKGWIDEARFDKWQKKLSKYSIESDQVEDLEEQEVCDEMATTWWRNSQQVGRAFEFRSSDWGGEVQLHDATCPVCDLAVVIIADDNCNVEVALLPCGHAFHAACITDAACPACFDINHGTLGGAGW